MLYTDGSDISETDFIGNWKYFGSSLLGYWFRIGKLLKVETAMKKKGLGNKINETCFPIETHVLW